MEERGRILVIDDERTVFESLECFLEDKHDLVYAESGAAGLLLAHSEDIDLVLLDVGMPDINGYDLCRVFKKDSVIKDIPVIFLTAFSTANDETMGLEAGAVDYIAKPINPAIVQARVIAHMALKLQRDYLEVLVRQDPLTQLINRRGFDEIFNREWRRHAHSRLPLSLLMMDIDSFKTYNDNYGHFEGDNCLQRVSKELSSTLYRGGDYLARYGGEEFIVLLAETPFEVIAMIAERVRKAIEDMQIPHEFSSVKNVVTISIGAASIIPFHADNPSTLITEADRMLYQVKEDGSNSVKLSNMGGDRKGPSPLTAVASS